LRRKAIKAGQRPDRAQGRPSSCAPGFTLVELLVVIAVIAILAALTMTAVMSAMESASTTSCNGNLGQIGKALFMYTKDYGTFLPSVGPHPKYLYWFDESVLGRYNRDPKIYVCPAKKGTAVGYGLNHRFHCGAYPTGLGPGAPALYYNHLMITLAKKASGIILACDTGYIVRNRDDHPNTWLESDTMLNGGWVQFPQLNAPLGQPEFPYWVNTGHPRPAPRHGGARTNCLFFDGHVEAIHTAEIIDDNNGDPGCLYDNQ